MTDAPGGAVAPAVLGCLRCPGCGGPLCPRAGGLVCDAGHVMRWHDGYLDARPVRASAAMEATFRSFGYEWTHFSRIQPEDEAYWRWYFADVDLQSLEGRIGLDAGCGKGRYTIFTSRHLKALVALDGSAAVVAAATNLARCPNVTVVRADLRSAPCEPASFGFVSCLGVLHHLEDPEQGFDALVRLLAPGGILLIYVYSRPTRLGARSIGLWIARGMRRVTTRMPSRTIRAISWPLAFLLWATVVQAGAHWRPNSTTLPLAAYHGKPMRVLWLDTFDRLSAPIEHRYTWADIQPWYQARGLVVDKVRHDSGLFVLAHKP
jgi:SAM-dependent methyltransferase